MTMFYFQICFFCLLSSRSTCCNLLLVTYIFTFSYVSFFFHVSTVIRSNNYIWFNHVVIFLTVFIKTKLIGIYYKINLWFIAFFKRTVWFMCIVYLGGLSRVKHINRSLKNIGVRSLTLAPLTLVSLLTITLSATASLRYDRDVLLSFTITTSFSLIINFDDIDFLLHLWNS